MERRNTEKLELNKILSIVSGYAVLDEAKNRLRDTMPSSDLSYVRRDLDFTEECTKLLFDYGVGRIEYFPPFGDELKRAAKGSVLNCGELLSCANLLRSSKICYKSVASVSDGNIKIIRELVSHIYFDEKLEDDIFTKILNDSEVSDYASDKLYSIRSEIRSLNERIRSRLQEYLVGKESDYLQDKIITMRGDRYVLPVKAEYKRSVKGFIHDKSQSGSTVFIEPEYILEMNNELRSLQIDEKDEVERILAELSHRVGFMYDQLVKDIEILVEIDCFYARAEYGYKLKCVRPKINAKGYIRIVKGRHPLIHQASVVPVSLELGDRYSFLLVSGPNTGGKTVTLKMVGLFSLMAACGLFIPAEEDSEVAIFSNVFCDIGDAQSIEENLSTFSSHISNIVNIVNVADSESLVLIDELGGGTDPEEGQAIAKAVLSYLLKSAAKGVVTTHYTALKEYAYSIAGIENASMEFDSETLQPLYHIRLGLPGSSNAIAIARRLGLKREIIDDALSNMSEGSKTFENIVRNAEEVRLKAVREFEQSNKIRLEWQEKLDELNTERERLEKERENLFLKAKVESRRIINEKTAEAEELLKEIEDIFDKEELTQNDLIQARTLKNRLSDKAFTSEREGYIKPQYVPFKEGEIKIGDKVFVSSFNGEGVVLSVNQKKGQAQVECGSLKLWARISDLLKVIGSDIPSKTAKPAKKILKQKNNVTVARNLDRDKIPAREINLLGLTVQEALIEVENFMDSALLSGFEEVRIVHGYGTGRLKAAVHEYLKKNKHVDQFRIGTYGEGEGGVTIVKLK